MHLILCHTTADFDTLGAAIGLTCLQPGAKIVLPGGSHPAVRDFLALHRDEYALIERRSVPLDQIQSITVVDTQSRSRLGKAAEWLDLPNVEVFVYDHHIEAGSDIAATQAYVEAIGSTTTLIVEQLQAKQVALTPAEATAMALGIHVDTGSLTFRQATARDARALAWLMEQGANLQAIADYTDPGLSPELQQLLTIAVEQLQTETVQGHTVAWVLLAVETFTPGLSSLASRLMDLTHSDALLLAVQHGKECSIDTNEVATLTVIGRSQINGTNLNALLKPLGGGGHPRAASVNLHQVNATTTLAQLVDQFKAQIPQPPTARELMSSPVRTIRPETTIDAAQRILLRYGHSGLSVVDAAGQLVGVISRRDLDLALHHGFSHAPVKGYMTTNLKTIAPETSLPAIELLMVTYDIGRLPVIQDGQLVGLVTRTDVLRQRQQGVGSREGGVQKMQLQSSRHSTFNTQAPFLLEALRQCLTPALWQLLTLAAQSAAQRGWHLYLVGGAVRDLLLALAKSDADEAFLMQDVDLVVDGFDQSADAGAGVELARSLQALHPEARLEVHGKFQTAALLWHHDQALKSLWVDIATARTEFYPYPAANPEVEASSIRQDLYRRDFTINALAIRLTTPHAGEVLDFFGGLLDLQAKQIRVLHPNSFIEDPTRIYRAVRFAVRLGFAIEPQTENSIRYAIASGIYYQVQDRNANRSAPALQTRLKAELKYVLQAPYWRSALQQLSDLGALQCIHPNLEPDHILWRQLKRMERWLKWRRSSASCQPSLEESTLEKPTFQNTQLPSAWLSLLEVLLAHLSSDDRSGVAENLQLPVDSVERLQQLEAVQTRLEAALPQCDRPSLIVSQLNPYPLPLIALIAIRTQRSIRKQIWQYLTHWSTVKPLLNGDSLKALGYNPGPHFKPMLDALLAATLDGVIQTRAEAEAFLTEHFPPSTA